MANLNLYKKLAVSSSILLSSGLLYLGIDNYNQNKIYNAYFEGIVLEKHLEPDSAWAEFGVEIDDQGREFLIGTEYHKNKSYILSIKVPDMDFIMDVNVPEKSFKKFNIGQNYSGKGTLEERIESKLISKKRVHLDKKRFENIVI